MTSGETIADLVQSISEQVETEKLLNEFIDKVEQYGYISEIQQESLSKLRLEKINGYEVEEEFPKISLNHVLPLIKNMKYSIDLSGCSQFEVDVPNILK
ncbi:PD-(D/E)XK motif protein [Bacillus cereus]